MSDYIVSARKYRPQTFHTVVGQEHITTTLKNAIRQQHLAHAYLFCGPRGVGKTTCARILAKTINCENPTPEIEACGVCPTCVSFQNNSSFNIFELDAASNNSVDDIRELVSQVRFAPQQGKYKIYIIDEVHMLSAAAFNAFLKTLEEPPSYAIFILATTEKHKILPTILSRCQIFDFRRITTQDTVSHLKSIALKEGMTAEEDALHVIAQKSEGCMRDSLSMLDRIASFANGNITYASTMDHLAQLDADFYFALTDQLLAQDVGGALLSLDGVLERGFEGDVILSGLAQHFRNLLLCKDPRTVRLLDVPASHAAAYNEKALQAPAAFVLSGLSLVNEADYTYKSAGNKRLHTEMCLIRLCYLLQETESVGPMGTAEKKNTNSDLKAATVSTLPAPQIHTNSRVEQEVNAFIPSAQTELPVSEDLPKTVLHSNPSEANPILRDAEVAKSSPKRRISKNLLDDLDEADEKEDEQPKYALSDEKVQSLFEEYKHHVREARRSTHYAYLVTMKAERLGDDQIVVVTPTELADEYAKNMRDEMIEFYRARVPLAVRVTTLMRLDEELIRSQQENTILSKSEIFELLAKKNPLLAQLRDSLGMQIEF